MRFTQIIPLFSLPLGIFFLAAGCRSGGDESEVVASYKGVNLTQKQLQHFIPDEASKEDSSRFAEHYIKTWLRDQAICDEALKQDPKLEEEVSFKVEDYRRKLMMQAYYSKLIQDSLRTEVTTQEILTHYEANPASYIATENMYSFFYVATADAFPEEAGDQITSGDPSDITKLKEWAEKNALDYHLDSTYVSEIRMNEVSLGYLGELKKSRPGNLIRWTGVIEGQQRKYLFKLINVVHHGELMPLALAKENILRAILNERKNKLIQDNEGRILREARAHNYIVE